MNAPTEARHIAASSKFSLSNRADHHRIVHVRADKDALSGFLDDVKHIDVQNLEYVPFMRFHLADSLVQRLGDDFAAALVSLVCDRTHGGFTMGVEGLTEDPNDFVRFGT